MRYWTPARIASVTPANTIKAARPANRAGSRPIAGQRPTDGAFPGPFTSFLYYPKYNRFPIFRSVKIFYRQNGTNYVASGTVTASTVTGTPRNRVWTAGHVVHAGNSLESGWSDNIMICAVWDAGGNVDPGHGCWGWTDESTTCEWAGAVTGCAGFTGGSYSRDYGVIYANTCRDNTNPPDGICDATINIALVTGSDGLLYNQPRDQNWVIHCYCIGPAAATGNKQYMMLAEHRYDVFTDGDGPDSNSVGADSSPRLDTGVGSNGGDGGGWILNWNGPPGAEGNAMINGNTSFALAGDGGMEIQSPYYDSVTCFDWAFWTADTTPCS